MKLKTLGFSLVSALVLISLVFSMALIRSQKQFDSATAVIIESYEGISIPLEKMDANTKNLRFHLYAAFMHDEHQSVAHYHTHPLAVHTDAIRTAIDENRRIWELLGKMDKKATGVDLAELKQIYSDYYRNGIEPGIAAVEAKDWGSIVKTVTGSLSEYGAFEKTMQLQLEAMKLKRNAYLNKVRDDQQFSKLVFVSLAIILLGCAIALVVRTLRLFSRRIDTALKVTAAISKGDLSARSEVYGRDEAADILRAVSTVQGRLSGVIQSVRSTAESVAHASAEIAQGNQDLSNRTEQQASALQQTNATMESLDAIVRQNADNARTANQLAMNASTVAEQGGTVVAEVVETMKGINASSNKIADIITVIDGIAFQTNILALNAAVEAARAGEQGRGFAVVAGEVRTLAQRSAEAAKEIKSLIMTSVERVEQGTLLVDKAGTTMSEVVAAIRRVNDIMGEISAASSEQSQGVSQVGEALTQMDHATQQNAALVEEMAAAAASLNGQAGELVNAVAVFKLAQDVSHRSAAPSIGRHAAAANPSNLLITQ